ncbi:MAG TPA: UDP-N-acetylmuramoyl-tripeptide--D-alanyl-D-alanine ligase, partial [Sphingomicrobium sp.]|nr:UDP-N-acetylmuramoyl-tripeptide--D-alanyl-D-alanine ligase [Sphingomicrobium sp.]
LVALQRLASWARDGWGGRVVGITGSAGKTTTKDAIAHLLSSEFAVGKTVGNFNNHVGVPLSILRLPDESRVGVLEMGMNHAGEIRALTAQVRPHVSLITAIAPAHIENLGSEEAIADAKAEVFEGLERDGVAIIPNDTPHRDRLVKAARRHADRIITFGSGDADVHAIHAVSAETGGSLISAGLLEREITFTISQRGEHWVSNALAVLAAVEAVGEDVAVAALALADLGGLKGRGERHTLEVDGGEILLIDESYNANPASMAATLKSLGAEKDVNRRIAVLGPMRELGEHTLELHAALAPAVRAAHVDRLILIGDEMRPLAEEVVGTISFDLVSSVDEATQSLMEIVRPGDVVLVKASNSIGLAKLVERMVKGMPCST